MTEARASIDWEYEYEEEFRIRKYYCTVDKNVLWKKYMHNDEEVIIGNCQHFEWESIGNGCYPDPIDEQICSGVEETVEKSIKKIYDGTTIYFLIPKDS
jgi:hypothetical protein